MKALMLKFAVATPVFVTIRSLADGSPHWFVICCFWFTAALLADMAISLWMAAKKG